MCIYKYVHIAHIMLHVLSYRSKTLAGLFRQDMYESSPNAHRSMFYDFPGVDAPPLQGSGAHEGSPWAWYGFWCRVCKGPLVGLRRVLEALAGFVGRFCMVRKTLRWEDLC